MRNKLLLIEIQVDQAGSPVVQNHVNKNQRLFVRTAVGGSTKRQLNLFFTRILNSAPLGALQRRLLPGADFGDWLAFPVAEFVGDQIDGCLDINVTADEYAHIVRHIVGVKVILDINQ